MIDTPLIDLRPDHLKIVEEILLRHVPDREVWAFGSRAKWTAKDASDLDLAIICDLPLATSVLWKLRDDFSESNLPIKVDVVDWATTSEKFRGIIAEQKVVIQSAAQIQNGERKHISFSECADLIRESVSSKNLLNQPYIGLEHIGQGSLALEGFGTANDVKSQKTIFKKGDVLYGKLRPYFRKVIQAPFDGICSTDIWVLRAKEAIDPDFLLYLVAQKHFTDLANQSSKGTRMPRADWDFVSKQKYSIPEIGHQRKIGKILKSFDDKIELNRKMNETLEATDRAIFKSWFIDFDPVRAKAEGRQPFGMDSETAALFPDSFEESELGMIPKGWEVKKVNDVIDYISRGITPLYTENEGMMVINQKCIRDGKVDFELARKHNLVKAFTAIKEIVEGDVLINSTGVGTLGRLAQVQHFPKKIICDTHVMIVRPNLKLIGSHFFGMFFYSKEAEIENFGEGSTGQTELSRDRIKEIKFVFPPLELQRKFDYFAPLMILKNENEQNSISLEKTRDYLLPKLLSGQISVPTNT